MPVQVVAQGLPPARQCGKGRQRSGPALTEGLPELFLAQTAAQQPALKRNDPGGITLGAGRLGQGVGQGSGSGPGKVPAVSGRGRGRASAGPVGRGFWVKALRGGLAEAWAQGDQVFRKIRDSPSMFSSAAIRSAL